MRRFLIFTDLDGTLLDHATYDHTPADGMLERLKRHDVPVILTTSKTLAELRALKQALGNDDPAIAENGAVIWYPDGDRIDLAGPGYADIRRLVDTLPRSLRAHFTGFGDMSVDQVAEITGLDAQAADLAKRRDATEPFLWSGSDAQKAELVAFFTPHDLGLTRGGRFHHIIPTRDKAAALNRVAADFPDGVTVALGDGPNDAGMLETADHGVLIPNPHGTAPELTALLDQPHIRQAPAPGPSGWAQSVEGIVFG